MSLQGPSPPMLLLCHLKHFQWNQLQSTEEWGGCDRRMLIPSVKKMTFLRKSVWLCLIFLATTRDKGTILTIVITVFCTLFAKLLSRNHVWKSFINDFLRVLFHHASALQLAVDVLLHVPIIGRLSRSQWLLNTKRGRRRRKGKNEHWTIE